MTGSIPKSSILAVANHQLSLCCFMAAAAAATAAGWFDYNISSMYAIMWRGGRYVVGRRRMYTHTYFSYLVPRYVEGGSSTTNKLLLHHSENVVFGHIIYMYIFQLFQQSLLNIYSYILDTKNSI